MARLHLTEMNLKRLNTAAVQEEFYDSSVRLGGSFGVRCGRGGKRSFFLIYSIHGKRRRMPLGTYPVVSLHEARERAIDLLREVHAGGDPKAKRSRVPQRFHDVAELFLERHARERCAPRTVLEYERIMERELLPVFGNRRLADLSELDVIQLLEDIGKDRKRPVLANRTRSLLGKLFSFAIDRRLIDKNPVRTVRGSAVHSEAGRTLTDAEIVACWRALADESAAVAAAYKLMLLTGQKPGAVLQMRWDTLQLDEWIVSERNGTVHRVALSKPALQILRAVREASGRSSYVLAGRGDRPLASLQSAHRRICSRMKTPAWVPGDLRRTAELGMRNLRVRPDVIEKILGRNTVSPRNAKSRDLYDYRSDVEAALCAWGQRIADLTGNTDGGGKVIQLFR